MTFSIRAMLAGLLVVASFFAGWMLPPPIANREQTPVLLAIRDIPPLTLLRDADFRVVYRDIGDVPDNAARTHRDLEGVRSMQTHIRLNGLLFLDDAVPPRALRHDYLPPGKKAVAVEPSVGLGDLTWHLLSKGDVVSVYTYESHDESVARNCLIPRCKVWDSKKPSYVSVCLTENECGLVDDAQKKGLYFSFEPPE